jgi:hypothetical protein
MTNTQTYLDQNFPKEQRGEICELDISERNLEGHLDLRDFKNLKKLKCYYNHLTSLDISNCKKLEEIYCAANEIKQDLAIFSHLKNLRILDLGYINSGSTFFKINQPNQLRVKIKTCLVDEWNNQFHGSLKALTNCQNLEWICLACQKDITGSLADLPAEKLTHLGCHFTYFAEQLKPVDYDVVAWQLLNNPEKFNREKIREKIAETKQNKTELLQEKKERQVQQIYRLKSKISLLSQKIGEKPQLPETKLLPSEITAQTEEIVARIRAIDHKGKKVEGRALMDVYRYDCLALDCERKVPNPNQYCWEHYFSGNPEEEEIIGVSEEEIEKAKQIILEISQLKERLAKLTEEVKNESIRLEKILNAEGKEWTEKDEEDFKKMQQKSPAAKELINRIGELEKKLGIHERDSEEETETNDFSESEESETEVIASSSKDEANEQPEQKPEAEQASEELTEFSEVVADSSSEISNREETEETAEEREQEDLRLFNQLLDEINNPNKNLGDLPVDYKSQEINQLNAERQEILGATLKARRQDLRQELRKRRAEIRQEILEIEKKAEATENTEQADQEDEDLAEQAEQETTEENERTDETEPESSQQNSEQAQKLAEEIVANIHRQAEQASQESVYNPPLSFDAPRGEYRPPKECADLYCHLTVAEEQEYCRFHRWESENDERFNAQRAEVFPNLPPRPTPEPLENQNSDLRTTVETDSASEAENPNPAENNSEILPEQVEQETIAETNETEPEQPTISEPTPQELAIAQVEKFWADNADSQGLINGKNITDTLSPNWKGEIANCSDQANLIPKVSELLGKIACQANQTSEEKSAEIANWKKFLIGGGILLAGGGALTGIAGWIGYVKLNALASIGAVKSATGFATVIKAGKSAAIIKKTAMAGLTWLKDFIPVGYTEIGPWIGGIFKWLGGVIASPWFWVPALIIGAIAAFYYRNEIWQGLKKAFNFTKQTGKKFANFFKKPVARFFRNETPDEKETREKKEELEQKETEVSEVKEQITQTEEQKEQLETEKDKISTEEFERKNGELTTKLDELTTKLEQLEQEKEKVNEEYEAIDPEIRKTSEAKEEQLLKNVETGLEISFWVGVVFILALIWKLIKKFFGLIFAGKKKTNGKETAEIKESLNQLTELEKQRSERESQRIKQEIEQEKLTTLKLNAERERVSQEKLLEQEKEQLTKQKDKQNPPAKKKKHQKKSSSSLTYYHRHREKINARRRANYRLRNEKEKLATNR